MVERRVALITGTRKGIGRFLAEHFSLKGFLVEGCSREAPEWTLKDYTHHPVDVAVEDQVKAMLTSISKRHGRLDVLINNAGIAAMNHSLLTPIKTVERVMDTNFRGTFLLCREGAKLMKRHRYGRIVNFSTVALPMRLEGEAVYTASKSAVVAFTQVLARELADFGITCNVVGPTPIETDLIRSVPKDKIERIVDAQAIKRMGRFEDIANVIDFFVREESNFVTGQVVYLGGIFG